MTKEDFNLLLTDIYPRLRYGLVVRCDAGNLTLSYIIHSKTLGYFGAIEEYDGYDFPIDECKPYLRPMPSITDEEFSELHGLCPHSTLNKTNATDWVIGIDGSDYGRISRIDEMTVLFDWLNAHHFDYRGLIQKELALEAPKWMYNKLSKNK